MLNEQMQHNEMKKTEKKMSHNQVQANAKF